MMDREREMLRQDVTVSPWPFGGYVNCLIVWQWGRSKEVRGVDDEDEMGNKLRIHRFTTE